MSTRKAASDDAKPTRKATRKATTNTKPQPKNVKRELTADEAFMQAWEYTYKNRHKKIA